MRKKLIFFIYIGDERTPHQRCDEGFVAKIHFACLKKYIDVFDEAKFVFSMKKELMGNSKLISSYVEFIMNLGYTDNVEFKVEENTSLRESSTFYDEIIINEQNNDKLVFFSHLRGESNDSETVARWVFSNYYYALTRLWEIDYWLIENQKVFYGYPMTDCRWIDGNPHEVLPFNRYYYLGSTYWINVPLLNEVIRTRGIEKPKITGRFFTENFPGDTISYELASTTGYVAAMTGYDPYTQFDYLHEEWCNRANFSVEEFNFEYNKAIETPV